VTFDRELAEVEHTAYLLIASAIGYALQNFNFTFTELRARHREKRNIIDQRSAVDTGDPEGHLRLMIDEDNGAGGEFG
jgi:hypothetical protein